jgi:hypothetical protein
MSRYRAKTKQPTRTILSRFDLVVSSNPVLISSPSLHNLTLSLDRRAIASSTILMKSKGVRAQLPLNYRRSCFSIRENCFDSARPRFHGGESGVREKHRRFFYSLPFFLLCTIMSRSQPTSSPTPCHWCRRTFSTESVSPLVSLPLSSVADDIVLVVLFSVLFDIFPYTLLIRRAQKTEKATSLVHVLGVTTLSFWIRESSDQFRAHAKLIRSRS